MAGVGNGTDIRGVKRELRDRFKTLRREMDPAVKSGKDAAILRRVLELPEYKAARLVLTYVSTSIEVDTIGLIQQALAAGKRVAVPYCIPGKIDMLFCEIFSMDNLAPGSFGVLEPDPEKQPVLRSFPDSVCILPGLGFDLEGYRLGYGKGYYDRFLSKYRGANIGVCYNVCLKPLLPHGRYDKMVNVLVTEKFVKRPQPKSAELPPQAPRRDASSAQRRKSDGRR